MEENEQQQEEGGTPPPQEPGVASAGSAPTQAAYDELNDKYLRLYANFENYKKRVNKDKEELVKYGNEKLLYELLPAIDNLELALKHAPADAPSGLVQGVEMTLKECRRTLEKFGLVRIEAEGRAFDPAVHHAMSQVERSDLEDKTVAEEFRAGYLFNDKVLRPSLVSVSVRPRNQDGSAPERSDSDEPSDTIYEIEEEE
ncbi:MAG: nucleotide exchange factor GrpE [Thermodesulfovibrionales bacterium]